MTTYCVIPKGETFVVHVIVAESVMHGDGILPLDDESLPLWIREVEPGCYDSETKEKVS
jgi:hypothetical protein